MSDHTIATMTDPDGNEFKAETFRFADSRLDVHIGDVLHRADLDDNLIVKDVTINYEDGSKVVYTRGD